MRKRVESYRRIRDGTGWAAAVWLTLGLAGCGAPQFRPTPELAVLEAETHQIEAVQLTDQSKSTPVTVEEATKAAVKANAEPNQPRRAMNLTLEDVRAAALTNNLDLKVRLIDPAIAQLDIDRERARFESVFRTSASYGRSELQQGGSATSRALSAGLETPLQTGGSVAVDVPLAKDNGVAQAAASVHVFQELLRGAGIRVNSYYIHIAGYDKGAVDAVTKLRAIEILGGADIAYWQLYTARKQLDISREQYKMAENQVKYAHCKVAAGSAGKIEIVYAEAGLSSRLDAMIRAETFVRDRERDLKRIMNRADLPLNVPVDFNTVTHPNPKGLDLDQEALVQTALESRMEMAELEFRLAIGDIQIAQARNDLLPLLTMEYSYAARGQAGNVGGAFDDLFQDPRQDHRIGLSATIPLGNGVAKAQYQQARLRQMQTQLYRQQQEQRIRQEVYDALDGLQQSWRQILAAEQGVVTAERDYRVNQSQFRLGRRDSTRVLEAASRLGDAQMRQISAYANYEITQVYLARATGTLLGRERVLLEPAVLEGK